MFYWITDWSWSWKWASQINSKCWWGWLQNWYWFVIHLIADIRSINRSNWITDWINCIFSYIDTWTIKRSYSYSIIKIDFFSSCWKNIHWYIGWRYIRVIINWLKIEFGNVSIWIFFPCYNEPKSYILNLPAGWRFYFSVISKTWDIFDCKRSRRDTVN